MDIKKYISNYKTKYPEGFNTIEIHILLNKFPEINRKKFNDALFGATGIIKNNQPIIYRNDVYKAVMCGIENRDLRQEEWD